MDTKRVLTPTPFEFTQEYHLIVDLLHRDIIVLDAREVFLHLIELVIVGSKEGSRMPFGILMEILHNRPGNRNTIVSAGASAQLVEEHEGA